MYIRVGMCNLVLFVFMWQYVAGICEIYPCFKNKMETGRVHETVGCVLNTYLFTYNARCIYKYIGTYIYTYWGSCAKMFTLYKYMPICKLQNYFTNRGNFIMLYFILGIHMYSTHVDYSLTHT